MFGNMSWDEGKEGYQSVFVEVLETFDDELFVVGGYFVGRGHVAASIRFCARRREV